MAVAGGAEWGVLDVLFRSDRIVVAVVDRDLRFVRVNETMALLNCTSAADHRGRRIREVVGTFGVEIEELIESVFESNEALIEVPLGGDRAHLQVSFFPGLEPDRVVVLGVEATEEESGAALRSACASSRRSPKSPR